MEAAGIALPQLVLQRVAQHAKRLIGLAWNRAKNVCQIQAANLRIIEHQVLIVLVREFAGEHRGVNE